MSTCRPITDNNDFWDRLNFVFEAEQPIPYGYYMHLYSYLFNHYRSSLNANLCRDRLTELMSTHLAGQFPLLGQHVGIDLLKAYDLLWKQFQKRANDVFRIFSYLNRTFEDTDKLEIHDLRNQQWEKNVFMPLADAVTDALLDVIDRERHGDNTGSSLAKEVLNSYVEMATNNPETSYISSFETKYLQRATEYYQIMARQLEQHNPTEYTKTVKKCIQEEHERGARYLGETVLPKLMGVCGTVLINPYLECFTDEFNDMMYDDNFEGLSAMLGLFQSVNLSLQPFHEVFENFIVKIGHQYIYFLKSKSRDQEYVITISDVYKKAKSIVAETFNIDVGFYMAIDAAMVKFVNHNDFADMKHDYAENLLVKCVDLLLRKSSELSESRIDEVLNDIMITFRYVEDKEEFRQLYWRLLTKYMVNGTHVDEEIKTKIFVMLKDQCGPVYVNALQCLDDAKAKSKQLAMEFQNHVSENAIDVDGIDLSVTVLPYCGWPFAVRKCPIPWALAAPMKAFQSYCVSKHYPRLAYLSGQGYGEITCNAFARNYTFTANTRQTDILMMFNEGDVYTLKEIKKELKVKREALPVFLGPMIKLGLFTVDDGESGTSDMSLDTVMTKLESLKLEGDAPCMSLDTKIKLNMEFTSRKANINLLKGM